MDKLISLIKSYAEPLNEKLLLSKLNNINKDLFNFLKQVNGGFDYERALHFFPFDENYDWSLNLWNKPETWICYYDEEQLNYFYFAEDLFGNLFCYKNDNFYLFMIETAHYEFIADSFNQFCAKLIDNYGYFTAYSLAQDWNQKNNNTVLRKDLRLSPYPPFFLGGEYKIENFHTLTRIENIRTKGMFYQQTKNLSNGSLIRVNVKL